MALHYVMFLLAACFTQAMAQASTPVCGVGSGDTPANAVGYGYWMQNLTSGGTVVCTYEENIGWMQSIGSDREQNIASGCQYFAIALCIVNMMFYVYHYFKATTGWEEVYVVIIELCKVCLELTHEYDNPASMYLSGGNTLLWIRYGEWLLSCPVILIHLSNLTGLKDEYNSRTMMLLVSDLGCVVMGITSAACTGYAKWIFFTIGMLYGLNTYFHAAQVYVESYKIVPRGKCQTMVKTMAWCYFTSWTLFPILFCIGPEGAGVITRSGSAIAHTVSDIMSKQVWSLLGHFLRVMVHDHMKLHGQMRMSVTGAAEVDANAVLEMTKPIEKKAKSEPSSSSSPGSSNRIAAWREEEA